MIGHMLCIIGYIDEFLTKDFFSAVRDPKYLDNIFINNDYGQKFWISSPGGDVGYMISMFDYIRHGKAKTVTIASGIVQSAAAVLLQSGSVRKMTRNSFLVFHPPQKQSIPRKDDPSKTTEEISEKEWSLYTLLAGLVADRCGLTLIEAYDLFDGTFISAEKAKQIGLIDEIIDPKIIPVVQPIFGDGDGPID